ncbi:MAG: AAA family ATPase [Actinomycetota bacterium]
MFLRSITIRGFKSFADKTVLEFVPGVSVIVGPNGSGKSNLVDAISWALGEQGPRALRGGQMADVIFAGTPSRPALGMAEVKLVIDNTTGKIPVPMTEIEISRTIFRSGESEYRIGGQVVRLMDVHELLSETGIGRALHTVVGQGQLEEVLLARPEDRRRYIEEAAGIAKHRRRKERAERKLGALDHDLLRLADVLAELRRQLKPLQQQAEMAKKHEGLTLQAEELSQKVAAARLRALLRERARRTGGWDQGLQERTDARADIDVLDADVLAAADARAVAARSLAGAEQLFRAASAERERADHGFREAMAREASAREDLAAEAGRSMRTDAVVEEIARVQAQVAKATAELEMRSLEMAEAEEVYRLAEERRREVEEQRRHMGEDAAARRGEVQSLEAVIASAGAEGDRLRAALETATERIRIAGDEHAALEADVERLDGQIAPLADERGRLEDERRALVERLATLEEARRAMQARKDLLDARRHDIEETPGSRFIRAHEGRAVGLLGNLVHAESGLERSLAAALGPLADAVVYEDGSAAIDDATTGDGAILAIASGGPVPLGLTGERKLLAAVQADPSARGIVSQVLKDVYLAPSLDVAVAKQREHAHASFVTPEGVLIGPAVIHTPREADDRLREILDELKLLAHDLSATEQQARPRRERLNQVGAEIDFLHEQVDAADVEITAAAERMNVLERDLAGVQKEHELLTQRIHAVQENAATAR